MELVKAAALKGGAADAVVCNHWAKGGEGALELADAVVSATDKAGNFKLLYNNDMSIEDKINVIAKEMYGAGQVVLADKVRQQIKFDIRAFAEFLGNSTCL